MILVDTSIWIDHLHQRDERLSKLLNQGQVLGHPFVTGEMALGNLQNRDVVLSALQNLPQRSSPRYRSHRRHWLAWPASATVQH